MSAPEVWNPRPGIVCWDGDRPHCEECALPGYVRAVFFVGAPVRCTACRRGIQSALEADADARVRGKR